MDPRISLSSSSLTTSPLKATAWSRRLWASRRLPSEASAMRPSPFGEMVMFSFFAMSIRWLMISLREIFLNSKC